MGWAKLTFPPLLVVPVHSPGFLSLESPSAMGDTSGPTENPLLLAPRVGFLGCAGVAWKEKSIQATPVAAPILASPSEVPTLKDKGKVLRHFLSVLA